MLIYAYIGEGVRGACDSTADVFGFASFLSPNGGTAKWDQGVFVDTLLVVGQLAGTLRLVDYGYQLGGSFFQEAICRTCSVSFLGTGVSSWKCIRCLCWEEDAGCAGLVDNRTPLFLWVAAEMAIGFLGQHSDRTGDGW